MKATILFTDGSAMHIQFDDDGLQPKTTTIPGAIHGTVHLGKSPKGEPIIVVMSQVRAIIPASGQSDRA
jgi:hypothetical protein